MVLVKRIKVDDYLNKFSDYCKNKFGSNLIAVGVFGSYALGYFDKKRSDYDIFVILKEPMRVSKESVQRKFKRISFQYLLSEEELIRRANFEHWTLYITLLTSARVFYAIREYKKILRKLRKLNLFDNLIDVRVIEYKTEKEIGVLRKVKGYSAVKWALPAIRKRLQMLTYIRRRKLIWSLKNNFKINKDILSNRERKFLIELNKRLRKRSEEFSEYDRDVSIELLHRINREIVLCLESVLR